MTASLFVTADGVVAPAVTADQMREIDRIAIEVTGPNLYQMMENAGRNLALSAIRLLGPAWRMGSIVVLAGTGGNGGGGICAARHLANRGSDVVVVLSDAEGLREVPAQQLATYGATTGRVVSSDDLESLDPALILDALIGYSLAGPPRDTAREMIEWAGESAAPCLSLDVPSGIDSTTGDAPGTHVTAAETMTLALPKTGLDVDAAGDVWLADIGIPLAVYQEARLFVPRELFGDQFTVRIETATEASAKE